DCVPAARSDQDPERGPARSVPRSDDRTACVSRADHLRWLRDIADPVFERLDGRTRLLDVVSERRVRQCVLLPWVAAQRAGHPWREDAGEDPRIRRLEDRDSFEHTDVAAAMGANRARGGAPMNLSV